MTKTIQNFKNEDFYVATKILFAKLNIPLHEITTKAIDKNDLFEKLNGSFEHVQDIYAVGMITDEFFRNGKTEVDVNIKKDYDGVLIFAVELDDEKPTRKILADISRTFNREYKYTPVIILFKYGNKLSLSNTQRQKYKINKEGEKATKVTILRDIDTINPHTGHIKILKDMQLTEKVNSYETLYMYWQEVFNVSVLNKSFYKELSNWYFWALRENNVNFPNAPQDISISRQEHNAKNIIRLLTRLLFVWFIKEKGLIPEELFEEEYIKNNLLKEFEPKKGEGLFADSDRQSKYYKAVLQNLFFATLNQEMGKRAFRKEGQNRNITNLMRYESYFTNPNDFVELVEKVVPFMNGGLFECLDKPHPTQKGKQGGEVIVYEDGFSDRTDNELVVPDYIFFGFERHVDLSSEYGTKDKANKDADIKGLITILKSYKFTVAENTPIEEDVALDPELLGKVFENLLASYNPETKTTARKQTGSFYTPREIVSYMVDESLIAYLKTKLENAFENKEELDKKLHELLAFDMYNPFENDKDTVQKIIHAIDEVKILDPAVGSGAFPMGTLQKMVHLLTKLDPQNEYWQDLQLAKAKKETDDAFAMSNKSEISQKLKEINEAFDVDINHPDYARKLYLIENCIFGVDIQPIAIQISKLRFFISLVVEQNVLNDKPNFGIRPLPNLESKFVCANTLIGIEKKVNNLFELDTKIAELEDELKAVRHKIFNIKTPKRKRELREEDKNLRKQIADELVKAGFETATAKMLSDWDPYDQNESSPFFDMEWMFGVEDGFDIVIGNPPYGNIFKDKIEFKKIEQSYKTAEYKIDSYTVFIEKGLSLLNKKGKLNFITPYTFLSGSYFSKLREFIYKADLKLLVVLGKKVFQSAEVDTCIILLGKDDCTEYSEILDLRNAIALDVLGTAKNQKIKKNLLFSSYKEVICIGSKEEVSIFNQLNSNKTKIDSVIKFYHGIQSKGNHKAISDTKTINSFPILMGRDFHKYKFSQELRYFEFIPENIKSGGDLNYHHAPKKLIIRTTADSIVATIDYKKNLVLNSVNIGISLKNDLSLEFILSIMNSKLIDFWYQLSVQEPGKTFAEVKIVYMKRIPLPNLMDINQQPFIDIVNKIIEQKANNEDTFDLETQLDNMIYKLYGLSDDEIKIVEGR